ncbi:MAG TPA: hypothetical protein VI636_15045 [Candidatus Angelobacter sp.]
MISSDYERPLFPFSRYCLYSAVFVKYHGPTTSDIFIDDLDWREKLSNYIEAWKTSGPRSVILDYLIDGLEVRGDVFFVFNANLPVHSFDNVIDINDDKRLDLFDRPQQQKALGELREYVKKILELDENIATVHLVPPVLAEGLRLSISFGLFKNERLRETIKEIVASKEKILAYIYSVFTVQEGRIFHRETLKTAVGAIMGRVNAHDFGHVLSHANLDALLEDDATELEITVKEAYFKHLVQFLRGLMVFGAEVTTSEPVWAMALPFMSQLIHSFASISKSRPGDSQRLPPGFERFYPSPVCKHLAESEGVECTWVRVLLDGREVQHLYYSDQDVKVARTVRVKDGQIQPDTFVSVPGGLIGSHGLYCILENIIRNGAKYGGKPKERPGLTAKSKEQLCLTLAVDTANQGFGGDFGLIPVRAWDDHSIYDLELFKTICQFFPPNCRPDFMREMEREDREPMGDHRELEPNGGWKPNVKEKKEDLWRITDEQGQLINGGWGIKEMRIAASWLRQLPVTETLDRDDPGTPVLKPVLVNDEGEILSHDKAKALGNLAYMGYEFYLRRPADTVLVGINCSDTVKNKLQTRGVDVRPDLTRILPHRRCLYRFFGEDLEEQTKEIQEIQSGRDKISSVLLLSGAQSLPPSPDTYVLQEEPYRDIIRQCEENDFPVGILRAHKEWIEKVLKAPSKLTLILHLSASQGIPAAADIVDPWQAVATKFNHEDSSHGEWTVRVPTNSEEWSSSDPTLVYDYHGAWSTMNSPYIREYMKGDTLGWFYERFVGTQPTQLLLFNPPPDPWTGLSTILDLFESALHRVGVVDERIFSKFRQNANALQRMEQANVFLWQEKSAYEHPEFDHSEKLLQWVQHRRLTILLIHQGMLDKIFDAPKAVESWVTEVKKTAPFVVVQSDRGGLLPKLPTNTRFVPFSAVQPWFSEQGASKYFLVQTLLSGRARGG